MNAGLLVPIFLLVAVEDGGVGEYGLPVGTPYVVGLPDGGIQRERARPQTGEQKLSKEEIQSVVHAHFSDVRGCYEAALLREPMLSSKLRIHFTIGANGKVSASKIVEPAKPNPRLSACLLRTLSQWQFPRRAGVAATEVSYPFIFCGPGL